MATRKRISTRSRYDPHGGWARASGSRKSGQRGALHVDFGSFWWLFGGKRRLHRRGRRRTVGWL